MGSPPGGACDRQGLVSSFVKIPDTTT